MQVQRPTRVGKSLMVRINRVYTIGGVKGETSLVGGERAPKDSLRIEAYGTVDELNAVGVVTVAGLGDDDLLGIHYKQDILRFLIANPMDNLLKNAYVINIKCTKIIQVKTYENFENCFEIKNGKRYLEIIYCV